MSLNIKDRKPFYKDLKTDLGLSLSTGNIWRGLEHQGAGGGVFLNPYLSINYNGFDAEIWGSNYIGGIVGPHIRTSDEYYGKDFRLKLKYNLNNFTFGITSYSRIIDGGLVSPVDVFNNLIGNKSIDADNFINFKWETGFNSSFSFLNELYISTTIIPGYNLLISSLFSEESIYFESSYSLGPATITLGSAFIYGDKRYPYGRLGTTSKFMITNMSVSGTKELKINDNFSIPFTATITHNPELNTFYLNGGFKLF